MNLPILFAVAAIWMAAFSVCWCDDAKLKVDFETQIQPLIESACLNCHNEKKAEGDLRLDSLEAAVEYGAIVPGEPDESPFYTTTVLPAGHEQIMPPKGTPLDKSQTALIKAWIAGGATWPESKLTMKPRMDFAKHIQPILETSCLSCHSAKDPEGDLDLSTRKAAFESGASGPSIVAFRPDDSILYSYTTLEKDADELMPPANAGGPLTKQQIRLLRLWIKQGAIWPTNVRLKAKAKALSGEDTPDNLELIRKIHALVLRESKPRTESDMADYSSKIPKTGAEYHMVAIKGGEFLMGSPMKEPNRQTNEGPQTKVQVEPFWMGKFEVSWDEYEPFMVTQFDRHKNGSRKDFDASTHSTVDAVSQPTKPYMEMSFGMGQKGYPAISMTQHAANKYCQWLSAQTGHFYRLATEAEWEYACRAGTTTAYSWGDSPASVGQYAWYYENANEKYQKVGKKKPNPWGLHDMHGNVMEWTVDQYVPSYFEQIAKSNNNPLIKPERLYPRTVRGGGWDDDVEQLRSASRKGSTKTWKQQDPQLPKSIWYHTDARWLGFRVIRPLKIPTPEEMDFYWNSATNKR